MNLHRSLLFASIITLLSIRLFAVPSTDVDVITKGDDTRLKQTVTYSSDTTTVAEALVELSGETGVTMDSGVDNNDWSVRDRKIIIHVVNMKLSNLMENLSSVLRFHWSRSGDAGKWTYRLSQDKKELDEEESLRTAAVNAQTGPEREKRENALADMVNLGSLHEGDTAKLKTTDPWRYVLATEPLGRDVATFLSAFPEARNAFMQGTEASIPVHQLSPQLQEVVQRIARSYDSLTKSIGASDDHSSLLSNFDKLQITINRRNSANPDILSKSLLGTITIGNSTESFDVPIFDPSSPMGRVLGTAIVSLKSGVSKDEVGKRLKENITSISKTIESGKEPSRDISSDPALRAPVKLLNADTNISLARILKIIAEKTKLNVISDCFPGSVFLVQGGERTLGEQLEAIRTGCGSNWTKSGDTLIFKDKEWFKKRTWAVPQVWISYWEKRGNVNDGLLFDDYIQIGNLRDEQIDHTIMTDMKLAGLGAGDAARNRQILRFYGMLSEDQQKLMSTTYLPVTSLSDNQWAALKTALATKGAAYAAMEKAKQFIQFKQSGTEIVKYTFSYYPGENELPVTFELSSGVIYKTPDKTTAAPPKL